MTILSIVQKATLSLDMEQPTVLFSSTERTWVEMANIVNICAAQILEAYDWQRLIKTATVTGDGVETAFPLPADYDRMVRDANLWSPGLTWYPSQQMQDFNQWLELQSYAIETWQQRWMIFGGNLNVMPPVADTETLRFGYISNNIVNGPVTSQFTTDTDNFILDDELLRLSIVWNWKKIKGYDFQVELAEYGERLNSLQFSDVGARQRIISGRGAYRSGRFPTGQSFP